MCHMIACTLGIHITNPKYTSWWRNIYSNESYYISPPFGADLGCPRQIIVQENLWFGVSELNRGAPQSLACEPPNM